MFLTLDQAAMRIARQTFNPEFTADSLKQLAEAGTLKICFRYRGTLGAFKFPAVTLPPTPEQTIYFDGYLRSLAKPRLRSVVETSGARQVIDQLTPKAVEIASPVFSEQTLDIQPPDSWGRVRNEIRRGGKIQPAMMECGPIPESQWLIDEADLDVCLQPFRSLTPVGAVSMQPKTTTTASGPSLGNVPPAVTVETVIDSSAPPDKKLPAWLIQNIDYIALVNREHKCSSAQNLFNTLMSAATVENKVVQKGTGRDREKLYFLSSCTAITLSTFRKFLPNIRAHVLC